MELPKEVEGMTRTWKHFVETKSGIRMDNKHVLVPWDMQHARTIIIRHEVGTPDTQRKSLFGKVLPLGEKVLALHEARRHVEETEPTRTKALLQHLCRNRAQIKRNGGSNGGWRCAGQNSPSGARVRRASWNHEAAAGEDVDHSRQA